MESPTVIDERERERERERVNSSPRFFRRHKLLFGIIVAIGVLVYAAFNVWVYQYSKGGTTPSPAAIWQAVKGDTFTDNNTRAATPTPRPTGPGQYACDEYGICNIYEDAKRVGCPKTYADPHCLNACGDKTVRCLKPK